MIQTLIYNHSEFSRFVTMCCTYYNMLCTIVYLLTNLIRVLEVIPAYYVMMRDIFVICHDVFSIHVGTPCFKYVWRLVGANERSEDQIGTQTYWIGLKRRSVGSRDPLTHRCLVAPHVRLRLRLIVGGLGMFRLTEHPSYLKQPPRPTVIECICSTLHNSYTSKLPLSWPN